MSSQKGGSVETLEPPPPKSATALVQICRNASYMHNVSHIVLVSGGQGMVLTMHGCERRIHT